MDGSNPRHQRASLSFPYLEHFTDALSLGGQSPLADVDMDEAWKMFDMQSPQCVSQDQAAFGAFRTSHDDLCAHPPKCPTAGHLAGHGGSDPSHMLFHTRHFDPQAMAGQSQHMHGVSAAPHANVLNFVDFSAGAYFPQSVSSAAGGTKHAFAAGPVGTPFAQASSGSPATSGNFRSSHFDQDEFVEQLSALSSPPPQTSTREGEDDVESTCDSDCGFGDICHDKACSEDPEACCEDESCLQPGVPNSSDAITSEDAIAAAALTSFVEQQKQAGRQQMLVAASSGLNGHHGHQGHQHSVSSTSTPSCLQFGLGPDMCISPQFLMNYQHLREAHNPLQPSSCTAPFCPVEDPSFYQECHIRHMSQNQGGLFDNIDLNFMMGSDSGHSHDHSHDHNHGHMGAIECGAKFPNGEAMLQHLWNEHRTSLNLLQFPVLQQQLRLDQAPGMVSSASSSVSISSQDVVRTPSLVTSVQDPASLSLPDASLPLAAYGFDQGHNSKDLSQQQSTIVSVTKEEDFALGTLEMKSAHGQESLEPTSQTHECLWCDTIGGQPCYQIFESAGDLHKHVLTAHTHLLKRDVGGTYSCSWLGCTRRDNEEKGGFAQKSKIDRHMQVHTGNKPFMCDICHQSFSANQALLQHKLIHEDSKPLSCDICGKTFRQHSALTMHIRTHTKVRPLKCPYCNKEFSESSNLSKHKRIHTGDGQYECKFPGCNRTFHRKDQLRRHSAQHSKGTSSAIAKTTANPVAT